MYYNNRGDAMNPSYYKGDIVNMWRARLRTKRCKLIAVGVSAFYIMEGGIVLWLCW